MKTIGHRSICHVRACLATLLVAAPPATARTEPVGYVTVPIHADTTSLLGNRLLQAAVVEGIVSAVAGPVITDNAVNFGATLDPAKRYTFELRSGPASGLRVLDIVSFSGNTLTLAESGAVTSGTQYTVRRLLKLTEIWGSSLVTPLGFTLVADFNPDSGDRVLIADGQGRFTAYFNSSNPALLGWVNAATGMAEDPYVRYPEALLIQRQGTSLTHTFVGSVKVTDTAVPLTWRFNPVCAVNPVATLTTLGLANTLQPGSAETADIVWSQDVTTGQMNRYFYSDGSSPGLTTGWRKVDAGAGLQDSDQGEVWVSSGLIIRRRGALPHTVVLQAPVIGQ